MKHRTSLAGWIACRGSALAALALATAALAAPAPEKLPPLPPEDEPVNTWFVRAGGRAVFGIKATISPSATSVTPGVFDNGFVLPDASGNPDGRTWNWGYDTADQVSGDQLWVSRLTGTPIAGTFSGKGDEPSLGGELLAGAELTSFRLGRKEVTLGFEVGYGYTTFSVSQGGSARGTVRLTSSAYNLNGLIPPAAPYAGSFGGPGPRIDLEPALTGGIDSPATAVTDGDLDSNIHVLKVGIWLNYPMSEKLSLALSLGYASIYADTQYKFTGSVDFENPGIPDMEATPRTIGGREWHPGFYAQLRLEYQFNRRFAAYLGGDFQYNKDLEFSGAGRDVTLEFGSTFAGSLGVIFHW